MKYVVDRFEGEFAILEKSDGTLIEIPKGNIPKGVVEGDVLIKFNNIYIVDKEETDKLKREINELMDKLFVK